MDTIVAIVGNKPYPIGYIFDTNIQSFVENFMLRNHYGSSDYSLCFIHEIPDDGVWTIVKVKPSYNVDCSIKKVKYVVTF